MDIFSFNAGKANGGGYPEPTGSINITENGTYNVKDKAEAVVDVQGGDKFELLNDGKWHFYFDFTTENQLKGYLGIYVNSGTATIDFGDGTPLEITSGKGDTFTYHEYSALGKYRVDVEGDININGSYEGNMGSLLWRKYTKNSVTNTSRFLYYGAIDGLQALKFVEIPDNSITDIREDAFKNCFSLQDIKFPDGLQNIQNNAFYYCYSLKNLNLPDSVTNIGQSAFYECKSLTNIKLSNNLTSIGTWAFYVCCKLQDVNLPDSLTSISSQVFRGCSLLKSINIPNGITEIQSNTFSGCTSLQSINLPDSITKIGDSAFGSCYSLTGDVKIPICTKIGQRAFAAASIMNYLFTDWTADDINNCTFGAVIFDDINSNQKIVFATQEIAEVAKNTTNLATYASYIHYVGEEG